MHLKRIDFIIGLLLGVLSTTYCYKIAEFRIDEVSALYEETLKDYYYYGCMEAVKNSTACRANRNLLK